MVHAPEGQWLEQDDWAVPAAAADPHAFEVGRIGTFRIGPSVRRTAFGEVVRALPDKGREVVELDLFDALANTPHAAPDGQLMADLAAVAALRHRHIWPMIGCGFAEGVPYIVRRHRLGRTLRELLDDADRIAPEAAAAILFAAADAIEFLATQGPSEGSCAMGGFDPRDLFLCFDGAVGLVGLGLKVARGAEDDPRAADLRALFELSRELDRKASARLPSAIADARTPRELARAVRRRFAEACAASAHHVGSALRRTYSAAIAEERARFGLSTLQ